MEILLEKTEVDFGGEEGHPDHHEISLSKLGDMLLVRLFSRKNQQDIFLSLDKKELMAALKLLEMIH